MPLLNKKAFSTDPPPSDLDDNEELFVCRQTNEVYRDYESFFKRTILCNSLVWSCEVTLKHGLTYEEAAESEKEARKIVERIPQPIKRGVLTLVHYTRHSRLDNLCDEVFNYIRERYQEGEEIEVKYKGEKLVGFIHNVIQPKMLTNGFDSPSKSKDKMNSPSGKASQCHSLGQASNVIVVSDDESKDEPTEVKSPSTQKKNSAWPDAKSYQYVIKLKTTRNTSLKTSEFITMKQSFISRKKGVFSREKLKLLLRLTCCRSGQGNEAGYWKVKDEYRERFDLSADIDDANEIFKAEKTSKKRKREQGDNEKKNLKKLKKDKKIAGTSQVKKDKADEKVKTKLTQVEIEKLKEEMKIKREKEKELRKKEREKARQERHEHLKEQKMFLLHWCIPKDDLDLDDHQELPKPTPVESNFSAEMFGDIIMVLEFLYIFGEFFNAKQDFPDGITLGLMEDALTEHDAEGSFYDIVRFLLSSILKTHAEEEEEEGLDDQSDMHTTHEADGTRHEDDEDNDMTRVTKAVSASASMAAAWAQLHQGRDLHELILDPFTCSEILRLHFLSSGASLVSGADGDTYRWQRRGGFTVSDDAGVAFRHHEHAIMRALVTSNIYDLNATEKLKILMTLCAQLLTYATTRDIIDDGFDRLRKARREWQEEQWADQRKDKEEAAAKYRKRMEEKAKEKLKTKVGEDDKTDVARQQDSTMEVKANNKEEDKAFTRSQGPVTEEQSIELERNGEIEREGRKENLKRKEKAYLKEMKKSQAMSGVQPIGTDRLFRRYWLFNSMNGLFIEDNDSELPQLFNVHEENDTELSDDDNNSDSTSVSTVEDLPGPSTSSLIPYNTSSISSLTKKEIEQEKDLCRILKLYNMSPESLPEICFLNSGKSILKCEQTCTQLPERQITPWSYLDTKEDLDKFLKALNPRGYREKKLRESLLQSYDMIVKGLQDNPLKFVNRQRRKEMKRTAGISPNQTVNKDLYKAMEDFIEATLRDQILDLEDRIWQAGLGAVKISDITTWRKQVENGIYDFLPDKNAAVTLAGDVNDNQSSAVDSCLTVGQQSPSVNNVHETVTSENMEVDEPSTEIANDTNIKLKLLSSAVEGSRPGTPVEGSFTSTPTSSRTPQAINPSVRVLAKAVLEVEQGIERKYLIPPLGEDEETKKRRQQDAADAAKQELNEIMAAGKKKKEKGGDNEEREGERQPENDNTEEKSKAKPQKSLLERWEESLMACTNLAQVFIHLSNLDNCISWDKSVLNARCRICRRKGDAEHMLLCDGCDRGHHMYCLKPPIKQVPEGDWFCSHCRPVEPRRSIRRRRKSEEESDDERHQMKLLEINQDESEDESDDEECVAEEEDDADEKNIVDEEGSEESSDDDSSVHMESCACCDAGGELLCCETCPLVYHLECAYPPLRRIPRGSWTCQVCTGAERNLPAARRVNKTVIKAANTKHAKNKEVCKALSAGQAKIDVKRGQSKKVTSSMKTDTTKEPRKLVTNRQSSRPGSETPTSGSCSGLPAVRTSRNSSPKTSLPLSGFPFSEPAKKSMRWPAAHTKKCEKLLKEIMDHEDSWPFITPVNKIQVPDYVAVIKNPMDLETIKNKLSSRLYSSTDEFVADMRQIFFNSSEYNKPRTREARAGVRLSAYFETRYGELGLDASDHQGPRTRRSR